MTDTLFIVCRRHGIVKSLRKVPDALEPEEFLFAAEFTVPDTVFTRPPVPVVQVTLTEREVTTADVQVDGQPQPFPVSAIAAKQVAVQHALTEMLMLARVSSDPAVAAHVRVVLGDLLDAGVDVRVLAESVHAEMPGEERDL